MALTIEDGSIVAGADSYVIVADLRSYAQKRGATLPVSDDACEVLLVKAMDYLQAEEPKFKGCRINSAQPLAWPRTGVRIDRFALPTNAIPTQLKHAQMALAIEAQTTDLMPTRLPGDRGAVTKRKIGTLETEYAEPQQGVTRPRFAKVDGLLAPLCEGSASTLRVVRA